MPATRGAELAARRAAGAVPWSAGGIFRALGAATAPLYAFFATFPVEVPGLPARLNLVSAVLCVAALGWLVLLYRRVPLLGAGPGTVVRALLFAGLLSVAATGLMASAGAEDLGAAVSYSLRFVLGALLIMATAGYAGDGQARVRQVTRALLAGGVASVVLAVAGYVVPAIGATTIGVGRRAQALFDHPNQLGMVLACLFPLALGRFLAAPARVPRLLTMALLAAGVVLSGSFVNTLLLAVGPLLVMVTTMSRRVSRARTIAVLGLTVALGTAVVVMGPDHLAEVSPRVARMFVSLQEEGDLKDRLPSVHERLQLYRVALETWLERPLTGVGGDNAYLYLYNPSGRPISHAHNLFVNAALTTGTLGLLAMVVFAFGWVLLALHLLLTRLALTGGERFLARGVGAGLLLLFLSNQSSDSLSGTIAYPLWSLIGVGLLLVRRGAGARGQP